MMKILDQIYNSVFVTFVIIGFQDINSQPVVTEITKGGQKKKVIVQVNTLLEYFFLLVHNLIDSGHIISTNSRRN